jgi:hypothetical protein
MGVAAFWLSAFVAAFAYEMWVSQLFALDF